MNKFRGTHNQGTIVEETANFKIEFSYRPHLVEAVRRLPGRYFRKDEGAWFVPKIHKNEVEAFAKANRFTWQREQEPEQWTKEEELPELDIEIPLKRPMFPFQKTGVAYNLKHKRVIVGDQPGLGKTTQGYATMIGAEIKGDVSFPCLIICPSSLKRNWQLEITEFTSKKAVILSDKMKTNFNQYYQAGLADFFIVNFESLKKYFVDHIEKPEKGKQLRLNHIHFKAWALDYFKSVIIDESHRVKSTKTLQTKFTKGICIGKEYVLAMTGTPVINKPKDLIAQLGIIDQFSHFGGYRGFVNRYCSGAKEASNLKELNGKLRQFCFYRRDKSDVLKDLPPKTRKIILCDINTRTEYLEAERNLEEYLRKWKEATEADIERSMRGEVMVRIGHLKKISARGKITEACNYIDDLIEQGEKVVLFAHHKEVINKIREHYPDAASITGEDTPDSRHDTVNKFQNDPSCKLIVCSIQAAGVGLTLTASSQVVFIELGWHAAIMDQCEDRCHRITQYDNVTCAYLLGAETIDEWVYSIIDEKRAMTNMITGANDDVETNMIDRVWSLFNQPEKK